MRPILVVIRSGDDTKKRDYILIRKKEKSVNFIGYKIYTKFNIWNLQYKQSFNEYLEK